MKKFVILAFSLLLLAGCSKNEIIIYESSPGTNDPGNEQTSQKEDILITFSASLESRKVTRSMSPMPKGLVSQIYAFETTDKNFNDPFAEGLYSTVSAGTLTGMKGYKMYLSNGSYNMYAFSENSSNTCSAVLFIFNLLNIRKIKRRPICFNDVEIVTNQQQIYNINV